jgi:hypothetical protein
MTTTSYNNLKSHSMIYFVELGVKINCQYYREILLMPDLLPDIREFSEFNIFQQDSAPAHRAHETVTLLENETPDIVPPALWPQNSPDLNPVDYKIGSCMQTMVFRIKDWDVEDLRQRTMQVWDGLDQLVIDSSVQQWRMTHGAFSRVCRSLKWTV